nr:LmeA family phospholipid-binding protein [Rhodococcus sp. HNM0563]
MVGVRKLIYGLVVLVGLALLVDFGAAAWSEYRLSRALREGGALESDPAVTIHGFPFLLQARNGHYENVEITADRVPTDMLGDITVEANLVGAHAEASALLDGSIRSVPVDLLYGRVMIDATELGQVLDIPDLQISAPPASKSDGTGGSGGSGPTTAGGVVLTGTVPVGPLSARVSVQADLVLDGDRVQIVASDLYFGPEGHADFTVPDPLKPLVLGLFTTTIEPQDLPFGVYPTSVEARGSRIVIEGEAHNVTIDLTEVQQPS